MRFAVIGLVFFLAVGTLLVIGVRAGSISHYKIHELTSSAYGGEECRLDGATIASIESRSAPLRFTIRSESGDTLVIESRRHPPDNFKIGNGVGLRGYYRGEKQVFDANDVTTACPSKYEGAEAKANGKGSGVEIPGFGRTPAPQN